MNNYKILLKAMFKNKLRFATASKRSNIAVLLLLAFAYVLIMSIFLYVIIELKEIFSLPNMSLLFIFFLLFTASLIVLIFGIISLISTLYLSKDTDFYSVLPVKSSTVFAAKLSYVYISEAVIVAAIALPLMIAFGIVTKAWVWFYIITLATILIVPALPLVVAAIVAIPVMFIASKLKNRSVVSLIFYIILFGGFFGAYIYFISASSDADMITGETMAETLRSLNTMLYVLYPFTALSASVLGMPMYGLGAGASTVINFVIFLAISAALVAVLLLAGKFLYAQSVKANNQTDNSKAKKGKFKSAGSIKSLMKREYISSLRTTQVAFQCYAAMIFPIIMAVIFGIVINNVISNFDYTEGLADFTVIAQFVQVLSFCILAAIFPTLANAASSTFSREGTAMASLKILPIGGKKILMSKVLAWSAIAVPVALISVVIVNVFSFNIATFILSLFSLVPLSAEFVLFGALWDIRSPKLKWTDPMQAIKHNGHMAVGMLICIAGGLITLIALMLTFSNSASFDNVFIVCWSMLYGLLAIFGIADILLYRKVDSYYNRIEI